jgi:integrase
MAFIVKSSRRSAASRSLRTQARRTSTAYLGVIQWTQQHRDDGRDGTASEATEELAAFVTEIRDAGSVNEDAKLTSVDDAVERFLVEHLAGEKGREDKTVRDYRALHRKWFSPHIGALLVRDVDAAAIDRVFGRMRRAGLSKSRMNQAKCLYRPFFRWAVKRQLTRRDPMTTFELPRSTHVSHERVPPEVEELILLLEAAVSLTPDVAPLFALGAVTGMRRGELVAPRRSRIRWKDQRITVDASVDGHRVKGTKTGDDPTFYVDEATITMLRALCERQDELAVAVGAISADPFLFSLTADASLPMPPDYVTKRVATLKSHLGIEEKRPGTVELEDEALRLFREPRQPRPAGMTGPAPAGAHSYAEIGRRLDRSERWAAMAIAAAVRRESAAARGGGLDFDGSILALRKLTSSELLDAGCEGDRHHGEHAGLDPESIGRHADQGKEERDAQTPSRDTAMAATCGPCDGAEPEGMWRSALAHTAGTGRAHERLLILLGVRRSSAAMKRCTSSPCSS